MSNTQFTVAALALGAALALAGPAFADKMKATLDGATEVPANTTAGHFHGPAEPGKNAGVVVPFTSVATSPIEGSATLTDAQAADLVAGKYYVNIHTDANKGGEIRGQVTK